MLRTSLACLRSCNDHNEMLSSIGYDQTCSEIIGRFGCQSDTLAINIPEFCPVSCRSPECAYRCDRSWQEGGEVPNLQQQRCWTQIEGGLPCLDAIKLGQDCHCKCASEYVRMGSIRGRKPGALSISDQLDGKDLSLNLEAIVGRTITLDFTGERMRSEEPAHAQGPRLKIIPDDQICSTAALAFNITGLSCEQPPGADALGGYICTTPPTLATPFLHRWGGIEMNACGRFLLCHCNELCDIKSNWVRAGYLEIKPKLTVGSMSAPLPGCAAYLPTLPPKQVDTGNGEILQKTLITSYISIDGGLRPLPETLMAVARSFASYTSVRSELLDADAPTEADVEVTDYDRVDFGERRLQACVDDDAAFQAEAAKAGLTSVTSCSEALTFLESSKDKLCNDLTLENAVVVGCRATCELCVPSSDTTTAAGTTAAVTTTEPEIVWPGASDAIHLVVAITTRTNLVRDTVADQVEYIKTDPQPLLLVLYDELEAIGLSGAAIPGQMWAHVALGPLIVDAPPDTTTTEPPPTWTASSMIIVILVVSISAGGVLSCICVGMYMYVQREKDASSVGTEDQEIMERSEGGYRTKRKVIPGTAPEPRKESKPGCLSKCYRRLCPKKQIRRIAPVMEESAGVLVVGARVRLTGLSQAHFNGLEGYVTGGPNDKGRYAVDVIVDDDEMCREMQTLSFKADNLLVLPPEHANSQAAANLPGRGPSSYRGGA